MLRTALVILAAGLSCATGPAHTAETLASGPPAAALDDSALPDTSVQPAVWKVQTISFTYLSMNTVYSCGTLEEKVTKILRAVAAHRALKVAMVGCFSHFDASGHSAVDVAIDSPVLATAEELDHLASTRTHRELVARVNGDTSAASRAEEQFPAYWRRVELSRKDLKIAPADCELVEALKKKVLPRLAVRVEPGTVCRARELSLNQPRLVAEVLSELPH